jgi:hypothetical protein
MLGPRGDQDGLALVAYPEGFDLEALTRRHHLALME